MTTIDTTPLVEITEKALEVLIRELGLVKTLRIRWPVYGWIWKLYRRTGKDVRR